MDHEIPFDQLRAPCVVAALEGSWAVFGLGDLTERQGEGSEEEELSNERS